MKKKTTSPLNRALDKSVALAGGQSELARRVNLLLKHDEKTDLELNQGSIWSWLYRTGSVPVVYAPYIERAVSGLVTRHELCPNESAVFCKKELRPNWIDIYDSSCV